jgi:hypothetical protein
MVTDGPALVSVDLDHGGRWTSLRMGGREWLSAHPGYRFVWTAHALLDVSAEATPRVPGNPAVRLYPEAAAFADGPWPPGAPFRTVRWPGPDGLRLDRLGPDDGTAVGAIVQGCARITVCDSGHALRLRLNAGGGLPASPIRTSAALWRNLGGFPDGRPYRSIGVEPMLGSVFGLAEAGQPGDAGPVPRAGCVEWELEIEEVTVENATAGAAA